jgi:PAS domain S-box-containing protein
VAQFPSARERQANNRSRLNAGGKQLASHMIASRADRRSAWGAVGPIPAETARKVKTLASLCGVLAIGIGAMALVGWTFGLPAFAQFFTSRSAMQPLTALSASFAGTSILAANRRGGGWALTSLLAGAVLLLAVQTLMEHLGHVDLGTDHWLFAQAVDHQPVAYAYPGRMAAPTAAAFLLVGIGLLLVRIPGRTTGLFLSACATAVLLLVTIALLGHLYAVAPLTGILSFTQVSLPTAIALAALSIGLLSLRPEEGWVSLLVGDTVGATAARWLVPVVVIVPVAVGSFALRGSEIGLYPSDFRLALTTAFTIVLLAALALWGTWQLDSLDSVRRAAEALRESEATLRAFFETEGLFASIVERRGDAVRYLAANTAFAGLFGRETVSGLDVRDLEPADAAAAFVDRLRWIEKSGVASAHEQPVRTVTGTRWFATTVSPIAASPADAPRFATASLEITERKRAEAHQKLLLDELNHRVKNTLAVVQSLAQQSFRGDQAKPAAKSAFEARLAAVASAHNLLVRQDWTSASMRTLVTDVAGPGCGADPARVDVEGPDFALSPRTAVSVALALHELCTNAVKYGALSNDIGRVAIGWSLQQGDTPHLRMRWVESGGPPVVAPTARGFGSRLIERALAAELGGPVVMEFSREGLVCTIEAPLSRLQGADKVSDQMGGEG